MAVYGLEPITDQILDAARAEAAQILDDARADCEAIADGYAERSKEIRNRISLEAERKGSDMIVRAKASAALRKQEVLREKKSELIDALFADVRASFSTQSDERGIELLAGLLTAGLLELRNAERRASVEETDTPIEVLFCQKDSEALSDKVLADVSKKLGAKLPTEFFSRLKCSKELLDGDGGILIRCGEAVYDFSFEALFSNLRATLDKEVADALFLERKFRM